MQRRLGTGAGVADGQAVEAQVDRLAQCRGHADFGGHAREDQRLDATLAQQQVEIGMGEGAVAGLVDHRLAGQRLQFVDQVMAVFAAHQQPAKRAGRADRRAGGLGTVALGRRQVGQVRAMAFAGMHHQQPERPGLRQQAGDHRDRRAQAVDVQPCLVGIAAGGAEVALHVDDQQRRAA